MEAPSSLAVTSCTCTTTLQSLGSLVRTNGTEWEAVRQLYWASLENSSISGLKQNLSIVIITHYMQGIFLFKDQLSDFHMSWVHIGFTDSSKELSILALLKMRPWASCCQAPLNNLMVFVSAVGMMRKFILIKPDLSSVPLIISNQVKHRSVLLTSSVHLLPTPCPLAAQMMLSLGPDCQC